MNNRDKGWILLKLLAFAGAFLVIAYGLFVVGCFFLLSLGVLDIEFGSNK